MNIYTENIKNKNIDGSIEAEKLKHSQEYLVLGTLRYLYPNKFNDMALDESPDLQDRKNNIGIEVTMAAQTGDFQASRELAKFHQEVNVEKKEMRINTIKQWGYSVVPIQEEKCFIMRTGTSNTEKIFFQKAIRKKLGKLERYRKKFKVLGLSIVLPELPTTEFEEHCVDWIREAFQTEQDVYDFVFVLSHRFCVFYDAQNNCFEKHEILPEVNKTLSIIGRMTALGELTLNDPEWR